MKTGLNRDLLRNILGDKNADVETVITNILNATHTENVADTNNEEIKAQAEKAEKEKQQDQETIVNLKKQVSEYQKTIKKLEGDSQNNDSLQTIIQDNQTTIQSLQKELEQAKISNAITTAAYKFGAINPDHVKKLIDLNECKVNKNGDVIGIDEQLEALKKDGAYLFGSQQAVEEPKEKRQKYNPVKGDKKEEQSIGTKLANMVNKDNGVANDAFLNALK